MSYSSIAQNIRNKVDLLNLSISNCEGINFDTVWAGDAHANLTSNLETAFKSIKTQRDNALTLADALDDLQIYKNNVESIEDLNYSLSNTPNTPENQEAIRRYNNQISGLQTTNSTLRTSIQTAINSISSVSTQFELVNYEPSNNYKDYAVDLSEMLMLFESGALTKLSDNNGSSDSLYDYYTEAEVDSMIAGIKEKYSGRDAAVNCALGVMQMAADVGLKLDYDWGGGHTTVTDIDAVATGVDCSAFASWAINQGAASTFNTRCTDSLIYVGDRVSYEEAQKGDILVYNSGGEGHVVMIVDNDPETQQFLVVEASGRNAGVIMQTRSYASLSGTYQARDLSSIYND